MAGAQALACGKLPGTGLVVGAEGLSVVAARVVVGRVDGSSGR